MKKNAVVYCVTGSHIQLTAVSIASIVKNYKSKESIDLVIIVDKLNNNDILKLKNISKLYGDKNISINIWYPPEMVKSIRNYENARFPEVTLWRLFLPSYLKDYDTLLYLDNDTLIYEDITPFFKLVSEENTIAAVRDFYFSIISEIEDSAGYFGVKTMKNYFNSGFILFNVEKFNQVIRPEEILDRIHGRKYLYLDQTILNILCEESVQLLPYEYNYQKDDHWLFGWAKEMSPAKFLEIKKARKNIKVRHFVEFEKNSMPWEHFSVWDQWERDFWDYLYMIKKMDYTN